MDALRSPVGHLPPEVYWRRRVLALAAGLLAIVVLFYLVRGLFVDEANPGPSTSPSPSATISPSTAPTGAAGACTSDDVTITLAPNPRNVPNPEHPAFTATIGLIGGVPCTLDTGATDLELLVTSGSDRVWSSSDCDATPVLAPQTLVIDAEQEVIIDLTWPRIRSQEGCPSGLPTPLPGTYKAVLTVQGIQSSTAVFGLEN